jgi:hypothetical protein
MSAIEQIPKGDWIRGPDGTQWRVVDLDDQHDTVHLNAESGADLWIDRAELRRKLAAGTFDHTTDRPEAEQ